MRVLIENCIMFNRGDKINCIYTQTHTRRGYKEIEERTI